MARRLLVRRICFAAAMCLALGGGGAVDSLRAAEMPAQYALPDETLFVVRLPNPSLFWEALKTRTKLGALITAEQRVADFEKLLRDEAGDELEQLNQGLDRLGLSFDDLGRSIAGELGYAGIALPTDDGHKQMIGLAWSGADDDLIDKWFVALERKLQDQPEGKRAVRREDLDLAGSTVVHLTIPVLGPNEAAVKAGGPPPPKPDPVLKPAENNPDAPKVDPDKDLEEWSQIHLLLVRGRDRLTVTYADVSLKPLLDGEKPEQRRKSAERMIERLRETTARFLAAAKRGEEGVVRRWQETPGLTEALPDGEPLVEAYLNLPQLVASINLPGNEEVWKFVQAAGLEKLGPVAYRTALDGAVLRSGLFVAAPSPRPGLLALLNQTSIKPEPADWVAKTAIGYQQISFDFGKAYQTVSQLMRESYPRGEGVLKSLENQSLAFLGTDPTTLLTALGKTHTMLTYLPTLNNEEDPRRANREDAAAQTAMALVWLPSDEALWRKLMQLLAAATAQPVLTEQGFNGLRYQSDELHGSWFIGNNYMVLALGKGVTEKVLANLRSTPRTDESLRGTDFARRAAELMPPTGAISFDLTDGAGIAQFANTVMQRAFADATDASAVKLKQLWPTPEEWGGAIGVSASAITVDANGVTYRSLLDLPSP